MAQQYINSTWRLLLLLLALATIQGGIGVAQVQDEDDEYNHVWLRNRRTGASRFKALEVDLDDSESFQDYLPSYMIVQTKGHLSTDAQGSIEVLVGRSLHHYLPHFAWLVFVSGFAVSQLRSHPSVNWVGPLLPSDKFDVHLEETLRKSRDKCVLMELDTVMDSQQTALFQRWTGEAQQDWPNTNLYFTSIATSRVKACTDSLNHLHDLVIFASTRREAFHVFAESRPEVLNKWSRGIVQNGEVSPDYFGRSGLLSWDHNLDGRGQIIGVGDTGIDETSCYFDDPDVNMPYIPYNRFTVPKRPFNNQHRKIVQYVPYADRMDGSGHGTHVAGSLAGSPYERLSSFQLHFFEGMAPAAKLAFFDLGKTSDLMLPPQMQHYFQWAYAAGARIHSNSWGVSSNEYTPQCRDLDEFSWNNKDFLAVFAAGNDGTDGPYSVKSPSTAKNALAVGASISSTESFREIFCAHGLEKDARICRAIKSSSGKYYTEDDMAYFSSIGPTPDGRIKPDIVAPGFYVYSAEATPGDRNGCHADPAGILETNSGTSMATPVVAGNLALVRQYFMEGFYPTGFRRVEHQFVPSGALLKAIAVAGTVALRGHRDATVPNKDGSFPKSHNFVALGAVPNNIQGFGRTQLSRVLKFANQTTFDLLIAGSHTESTPIQKDPVIRATGSKHEYKMCILGTSILYPPTITLTWTDYPGSTIAGRIAVVNDLDLEVSLVGFNNTVDVKPVTTYPNGLSRPDRRNTVEKVVLPSARMFEIYTVRVSGFNVPIRLQPYALVITGQLRMAPIGKDCDFTGSGSQFSDGSLAPDTTEETFLERALTWMRDHLILMFITGACLCCLVLFSFARYRIRRASTRSLLMLQQRKTHARMAHMPHEQLPPSYEDIHPPSETSANPTLGHPSVGFHPTA